MQVQGKDRAEVEEAGRALGLEGTYIPHSYIELVQIGHLTEVGGVGWRGVGALGSVLGAASPRSSPCTSSLYALHLLSPSLRAHHAFTRSPSRRSPRT